MRVLVIDDSAAVRSRLSELLRESRSFERIDEASDAVFGISLARLQRPEAVILDLQLSDSSGLDVLPVLKRTNPPPTVIVLTNHATAAHRRECMARGADYFFDKSREFERAVLVVKSLAEAQRA
jgi:DNA-binding NarL/FixJ family response regulator